MAIDSKLNELKVLLGVDSEDTAEEELLKVYLKIAERNVLNRLYPFSLPVATLPSRYNQKVVEIAQYLYLRRGSEGETSHSENGVSRSYESADIPKHMLSDIMPMVGVV